MQSQSPRSRAWQCSVCWLCIYLFTEVKGIRIFPFGNLVKINPFRGPAISVLAVIYSSDQSTLVGNATSSRVNRTSWDAVARFEMEEAERHAQVDQVLASARRLRQAIGSCTLNSELTLKQRKLLEVAEHVEGTCLELSSPPDPNIWHQIREVHDGKRDVIAHYKLDEKRRLTGRIEFLISRPLLVPILAVLVETELYNTWVPRWHFPPVGISQVTKLVQIGRTNQVLHVELDIPWKRDIIIASTGIEDVDETGLLGIHLGTLEAGKEIEGTNIRVPVPQQGVERVHFAGCFVFQKCPPNHPVLGQAIGRAATALLERNPQEDMILVGFSMFVDAKLSNLFPQWIANFIVRVAMMRLFRIFINVAEDVLAGKRTDHTAAIAKRRCEIYDWIDERVAALLQRSSS